MARILKSLVFLLLAGVGHGLLTLSSIFSDNCVMQTNAEYGARSQVYGWCEAGEDVTVAINYLPKGASYNITSACDASGYFEVTLNPLREGSVFDLVVTGTVSTNTHTAKGCEAGDVYFCGGQSNQCFSAESAFNATALWNTSHPNLRLFSVVMAGASSPQRDFNASLPTTQCTWNHDVVKGTGYPCNQWNAATPETQGKFSAVCLFTALQIAERHTGNRPIGLIYSAFGGTSINLWAPPKVYEDAGCPGASTPSPSFGSLFNAMVSPLVHYSIRSVLFFQGEADQGLEFRTPGYYSCRMTALIKFWRGAWGMGDFPFNLVQLGPVVGAPNSGTGDLRYAQNTVLPHPGGATDITGMAAAYDLGDASSPYDSVHFRNKVVVGARLASAVLHTAFGLQNTSLLPPRAVVSSAMGATTGGVMVVVETLDGGGVGEVDGGQCTACCKGGGNLDMFQVAVDRQGPWVPVTALAYSPMEGSPLLTNITVTPATPGKYSLLRFAYAPYPQCALLGRGNGLPLPAFLINISAGSSVGGGDTTVVDSTARPAVAQAAPTPLLSLAWKGTQYTWRDTDPKPPMGVNTWNAFHTNVDEVLVQATGQALVSLGLRDLGWMYVNIDDGWQVARNGSGFIVEDPTRFPSGMAALSAAIHASGLKFGLYTSATSLTCQQRPGSYHMEAQDAASYCAFDIDYIKVDNCGGERYPRMNTSWLAFRAGINACSGAGGRPITLSVEYCRAGQGDGCSQWVSDVADLWRTTGDVQANWASMMSNLEENNANAGAARSGKYNDPDMITLGLAGVSLIEAQSQFSAFAVVCAPMLLSLDLTNPQGLSPALLGIISNPEVIAVGQDDGRVQGVRVSPMGDTECWARPLAAVHGRWGGGVGGALAVLLLNKGDTPASTISCNWAELGIPEGQMVAVRDLVGRTPLQNATGEIALGNFPPHSSRLVKVTW